ncbi:hypothetical protein [Yersinia phage fHe-Yen9-04]|uniref:Uncharacterized protein n=1 Tax=Yersinia phage fHe-Yen9-04 TaxID=2052742 RepID=A0A2C9CXE5_9CAUD|nr:virion structural protein [Yersinia phage fHe-Yen9-04]SOK58481.1 hypothetical protein [Yersinia phage fHe-Yen9-04]VUE36250.1 hypothetical protein [Yersinia phage fHe-Yen9-04]
MTILGNIKVPNNYVYTSHKGTEYVYLDGSWLNCETMNEVSNVHNFKMNQSAIKQIAEHNNSNELKIGKKYLINESEYVYVGRNQVTKNDSLLHESINKNIVSLMEAGNSDFSNFVRGNTTELEIPNKFQSQGYTYNKSKNTWSGDNGEITDTQDNKDLNSMAIKDIQNYNSKDDFPVNSTIDWQGKTLTWNGNNWVNPDGRIIGNKFNSKVYDYLDEFPSNNKSSESEADNSSKDSSSDVSDVPNGYIYTSAKQKRYIKKNGQWISLETKKPINSSTAAPLERAAIEAIKKQNTSSKIKIGQELKNNYGQMYRYVGGLRFISDEGKSLPEDVAREIISSIDDTKQSNEEQPVQGNKEQPAQSVQGNEEPNNAPNAPIQPAQNNSTGQSNKPDSNSDPLQALADEIKSNSSATRIIVLLSRGDKLSLMAADILLSGKKNEALQILNSLNNTD